MINIKHILNYSRLICVLPILVVQFCTSNPSSLTGGTEIGNPVVVTGCILRSDGSPAPHTQVCIIPVDYTPSVNSKPTDFLLDTTDAAGAYTFRLHSRGVYNIQADNSTSHDCLLLYNVACRDSSIKIPSASLTKPGFVQLFPQDDSVHKAGYYYIPGTRNFIISQSTTPCIIDSVPTGIVPSITYASFDSANKSTIRYNIEVVSGDTAKVFNLKWKYSRKCILNTSATGANVVSDLTGFPVLIRLSHDSFDFTQANNQGGDIRFAKPGNVLLPFEIELWDSAGGQAVIWVKTDTITGNNSSQYLTMYWGASTGSATSSLSNGAKVFDTASGFAGVWHLGLPTGSVIAEDATINALNGTATATSTVPGAVGMAQMFNGVSSSIQISGPAIEKLNYPENADFSVSAWVKVSTLDSLFHGIVYKSNIQYGLQIKPENQWEFFNYVDKSGWEMTRAPARADTWHSLVGVRSGKKQFLYVDGVCVDSTIISIAYSIPRATDQPLEIGHCPDGGTNPDRFFNGEIDEVRIARIAYTADWIKLCYMNQKEADKLLKW